MDHPWFELVLAILVNGFVAQVITADTITAPIRDWICRRNDWFCSLVSCTRCAGMWTAGPVVCFVFRAWPWQIGWAFLSYTFACSMGQFFLASAIGADVHEQQEE